MVENVTQIKSGITVNISLSAETQMKIKFAKMITFVILLHRLTRMVNI